MMPSYNEHRFVAIYFISYMLFSFFYLMNLVLAVACNSYHESIAQRRKYRNDLSRRLLTEAFELLDHEKKNEISRNTVMNVMVILNQDVPEIKKLSGDEKSIFFAMMDKDGSSSISLDEFLLFGKVLLLDLRAMSEYATFVEINFPSIYSSGWYQRLCHVVKSDKFDSIVDLVLLLNACVIGIQDYALLFGQDVTQDTRYNDGSIDTVWETLETLFTLLYLLEAMLKINVNGWKKYSESGRNLFDFTITIVSLAASAYVYYPNSYNNSDLIKFIVMARVLRLARVLFSIEGFRMIGAISLDIVPAATSVFTVLLFISYFFSWTGMMMFGGLITRDPNNPIAFKLLQASDFVDNDYWANNFNDMMSGINVLFNLLVVNNWTNCEIGFEYVTGNKWIVRGFFFSFHVLGVIGISNVITSFIINAFFQQMKTIEQRKGWEESIEGEAVIRGSTALFDTAKITGTDTGVDKGLYQVRVRPQHL
jgi:two pore calcium channel protein